MVFSIYFLIFTVGQLAYVLNLNFNIIIENNNFIIVVFLLLINTALLLLSLGIRSVVNDTRNNFDELEEFANTDILSGLPNRRAMYHLFEETIHSSQFETAFCIADLDNFKILNDTYGHEFGDKVIEYFAREGQRIFPEYIKFGRIGGDEFFIIYPNVKDDEQVIGFIEQIIDFFNEVHYVDDKLINITVSVGIALYPTDGKNIEEIYRKSDMALYSAKDKLKNGYSFYTVDNERGYDPLAMQVDILEGLDRSEFVLHYQPIINASEMKICGVEALVRWNHHGKLVYPDVFLNIVEFYGYTNKLDLYVLEQACKDYPSLAEMNIEKISVNLSAKTIINETIVEEINAVVEKYTIPPEVISFEITETAIINNELLTMKNISLLRKKGYQVSLDDFCTGYSSLNQLSYMDVDTLKIDKSFIDGINTDYKKEAIVNSIVRIGEDIGIAIVAEGIETKDQEKYLKEINCENFQGYLYSKPVPIEKLKLLQKL
jgi:polar amino acid transport system substrate-binding protein